MARIAYECNPELRASNISNEPETIRPFACTPDKGCLYCCCNAQCCLLIQRRPPKHFWEAWYFWLGIVLLMLFIISSVSNYVITNCRHNWPMITLWSSQPLSRNDQRESENVNEISIHVIPIPTTGVLPSHRKLFFCAPETSASHMTPIVA